MSKIRNSTGLTFTSSVQFRNPVDCVFISPNQWFLALCDNCDFYKRCYLGFLIIFKNLYYVCRDFLLLKMSNWPSVCCITEICSKRLDWYQTCFLKIIQLPQLQPQPSVWFWVNMTIPQQWIPRAVSLLYYTLGYLSLHNGEIWYFLRYSIDDGALLIMFV